jgi:hypothetical protein
LAIGGGLDSHDQTNRHYSTNDDAIEEEEKVRYDAVSGEE